MDSLEKPEMLSPGGRSRYGRTRRPKVTDDFYATDQVVFEDNIVEEASVTPGQRRIFRTSTVRNDLPNDAKITKIDDLGIKIANNFRANFSRGLDDPLKERKFFKSGTENKAEFNTVGDVVDVNKVLKLISTKSPENCEFYNRHKSTPKTSVVKTYTNRRKPVQNVDHSVVESFGLPDEPIIPINNPKSQPPNNGNIDVDLSLEADVNLHNPWVLDEVQAASLNINESNPLPDEIFEDNFIIKNGKLIFPENVFNSTPCERKKVNKNDKNLKQMITKSNSINNNKYNSGRKSTLQRECKSLNLSGIYDDNDDDSRRSTRSRHKLNTSQNLSELVKNPIKLFKKRKSILQTKGISNQIENLEFPIKIGEDNNGDIEVVPKEQIIELKEETADKDKAHIIDTNLSNDKSSLEMGQKTTRSKIKGNNEGLFTGTLPVRRRRSKKISLSTTIDTMNEVEISVEKSKLNNDMFDKELKTELLDYPDEESAKLQKTNFSASNIVINPVKLNKSLLKSQVRVILKPLFSQSKENDKNLSLEVASDSEICVKKEEHEGPQKLTTDSVHSLNSSIGIASDSEIVAPNKMKKSRKGFKRNRSVVGFHKSSKKRRSSKITKVASFINSEVEEIDYFVGDLAWAKIGTHSYWPCIVIEDPHGSFKKTVIRRYYPFYHVRFFGDKGRRSWVSAQHMLHYTGRDDLDRLAANSNPQSKTEAAYIKECCNVKPAKLTKWLEGLEEIDNLRKKSVEQRLNYFYELIISLKERKPKSPLMNEETIKEEITSDIPNKSPPEQTQTLKKKIKLKRNSRGNIEVSAVAKKLKLNEEIKEVVEDVVKKETSEHKLEVEEIQTTKHIDDLNLKNKKQAESSNSNSDTDSKFSDNSSVLTSIESQVALFKRNKIFKGVSKEKVCQICEKPGDILKCKGACNGFYHYHCAIPNSQNLKKDGFTNKISLEGTDENPSQVEIISVTSKKSALIPQLQQSDSYNNLSLAEKIDFRMKEIMKNFEKQTAYGDSTDSSSEECLNEELLNTYSTARPKSAKKEVPIIKHVTADHTSYVYVPDSPNKSREALIPEPIAKIFSNEFKCCWCLTDEKPNCLVCQSEESQLGSKLRQKCSLPKCGKYYHRDCLKFWPQTQWSVIKSAKDKKSDASYDTFVCPRHVCHTCISDDPRAANPRLSSDKVVKCLRCPSTYHSSYYCVPAGSYILSTTQIICPRHYTAFKPKMNGKKRHSTHQNTINANWCFICSEGGNLICCETCPTSVHIECLPGGLVESDTFYCEDCQSGRLPLYDEIVWVKLGHFRWWPALIMFPNEVPENVRNAPHAKGEFVVKFFGTYDYYWVGRGRSFLFQEGDKGHCVSSRSKVDSAFAVAIEEATAAHQFKKKFKTSQIAEKNTGLKPPPYIRIKVNKPVGNVRLFDGNTSNTTACNCDPNQPHPCGPDSDCLNRLLLTECNPEVCPAGTRCKNQCFEKREYPPLVPYKTEGRGWGLKTLAPIRKGQFVIEYVGELIDEQEYQRRIRKMHEQKEENYYFLTIDNHRMIDAGPKGNVSRFMNHSCQPNCETQKWTVNGNTRVGLFAKYDIPADTELTFNYNLECIGKEKKICRCEAPNCSGYIGVKVKTEEQKKKAPKKKVVQVTQPVVVYDNPCFICDKTGDVGACNNKACTKYYHLKCVGLTEWPGGAKWICSWHNCNLCSKRTIRCCIKCLNSYCPSHSKGNVRYDKLLGFICSQHDPIKIEELNKASDDLNITETAVSDVTSPVESNSTVSETVANKTINLRDDIENDLLIINGATVSTSLAFKTDSQNENAASCADSLETNVVNSKKRGKKRKKNNRWFRHKRRLEDRSKNQMTNTASSLVNSPVQTEIKLSKFTPTRHLRANSSSETLTITDPDKDLPIRKRTRLRCGNTM